MKYRHAAFYKDGKWFVLAEDEYLNVVKKEVPEDEVFMAREIAWNEKTHQQYYEDLGPCWEGEI